MSETIAWIRHAAAKLDETVRLQAETHQGELTKPPGSLGRLEREAVRLAAMQHRLRPRLDALQLAIFAADHGVVAEGVSRFPQSVTAEMVRNFARGGAAINVLARALGGSLEVVNLGTVEPLEPLPGVIDARIAPATANFVDGPAMDRQQLALALLAGRQSVERARQAGADLYIAGEMGIGNTTAAAALACALTGASAGEMVGPGTGLDDEGVRHKAEVVARALALHGSATSAPLEALRRLGGFEIAAMCGAYIACAQSGLPVLVDGFISSSAALSSVRIQPEVRDWLLFAHTSAEPGHRRILTALDADPLLDLGMRLGEGSGAAAAVPLLRLACALHGEMATFSEARVSAAPSDG